MISSLLDIATVYSESWQALLCVGCENGGQINRAGALGAVEAPHGLGRVRFHIHRFGAIAPAGCHSERDSDIFSAELIGAGSGLGDAANAGIGDHAFDLLAGGMAKI